MLSTSSLLKHIGWMKNEHTSRTLWRIRLVSNIDCHTRFIHVHMVITSIRCIGMDSRKRTFVKTLLWRFIASGTTVVVVFLLSGNIALGLTAAAIGIPLKLFMYYFYERFWATSVEWGKINVNT